MSRRVALIHRPTLTPSHQAHPSHTHLRSSSPAPVSLRSRCALAWGYCISLVGSLGPSRLLATRSFHSCIQKHTNSLKSTHTSVYNQPWHDSQPLSHLPLQRPRKPQSVSSTLCRIPGTSRRFLLSVRRITN